MYIFVNDSTLVTSKTDTLYNPTSLQRGWREYSGPLGNLCEEHHVPLYKFVDGQVVQRTQAEIDADIAAISAPEPTPQEQTDALMLDHEERLIYLELGVNNNAVSGS